MFGQTDRYASDGETAFELGKLANTSLHLLAVIHIGAEHELGVEVDPGPFESCQIFQDVATLGIADKCHPQLRIGGMYGDVHRRNPLLLDPLPILFTQVGQGDEAAVEHGIAVIVIHDVKRLPHAFRNLLDKTERACVFTDPDTIEGRISEGDPPVFVAIESQFEALNRSIAIDFEQRLFRLSLKLEIKRVHNRAIVDRNDPVSWMQSEIGP